MAIKLRNRCFTPKSKPYLNSVSIFVEVPFTSLHPEIPNPLIAPQCCIHLRWCFPPHCTMMPWRVRLLVHDVQYSFVTRWVVFTPVASSWLLETFGTLCLTLGRVVMPKFSERIRLSINRRVQGTRFVKELTIDFYKIALLSVLAKPQF